MKRKLSFLFLSALTIPFFMVSCSDDKEEQEVKPATDLVVDNNSVTLLQGDEITVSITSGNGDYYVKPFDENVATATIKGKTITIPVVVNIVDLTLKSNEATFAEPDAESQYISIERGNGGYSFTYQVGDGEPTTDATIVEATEKENLITLKPKARGDVKVIVTDQKGSVEEISVKVNPYNLKLEGVRETLTPADNSYEDCAPNSSLNLTDVGGNDKALLIGRSGDSYRVGYCKVYQARMWKRALDESEIKANMCKILNAEEHSDLMGYWVFSKGVGGTTVFENWGNGGSGLDAQVCLQNISENKPAWGAELPATYNGDKSRFEPIECPHSY